MMIAPSILLAALCVRLASAAAGHVYIYDGPNSEPITSTSYSRSLSPVEARLVLAQRSGVEDYHGADLKQNGVLDAINDFGRRTSLFEQDETKKVLILVEGVADPEMDMPQLKDYRSFTLSPAPGASANRGLWIDLARQSSPTTYPSSMSDEGVLDMLQKLSYEDEGASHYIAKDMADFESVFNRLVGKGKSAITSYITPPGQYGRTGDGMYQWGTYEMPDSQSPLRKREARSPQEEAPLEVEPTTEYKPVESSSMPVSSLADSSPLPGILPACFSSQSACESATRNCTGHGQCHKAFTDNAADNQSPSKNCYSCQCSATKQTTSEGKTKTTYWGGPACQKKDISVQFWLLALFTIGLVFLVGFAVGEIWGMGSEELPSVIGAGVSGPVKRS